jgi:hypothetical protein
MDRTLSFTTIGAFLEHCHLGLWALNRKIEKERERAQNQIRKQKS